MNSTAPKHEYFGHYTKSGNLIIRRHDLKPWRVEASEVNRYLAYLTGLGHTFTLVSKK